MSGLRIYVDESKRADYTMAAVGVVGGAALTAAESSMRGLLLPGQRSIHFKKESDGRKRTILAAVLALEVEATVFVRSGGPHVEARRACLEALAVENLAAEQIVLDLSEGDRAADVRVLRDVRARCRGTYRFAHEEPHRLPGLWLADVVAWSWARGGEWRRRVRPLVDLRQV